MCYSGAWAIHVGYALATDNIRQLRELEMGSGDPRAVTVLAHFGFDKCWEVAIGLFVFLHVCRR